MSGDRTRFPLVGLLVGIVCLLCAGVPPVSGEGKRDVTEGLTIRARRVLYEAQQALDGKEPGKAARLLRDFLERHPRHDHCLVEFTLGNALYFEDKKQEALARYRQAVRLDPRYGPAWINLGQVAYELQRYGEAAEALAEGYAAAAEGERDPELLYYAAVAHIMDGRPDRAVPILEGLVSGREVKPRKAWFQALLSTYLDLHREKAAQRLLARLRRQYGDDPETWVLSCRFEASRQAYKMAAVDLTIAGYLRPLDRQEAVQLGDLYAAVRVPVLACRYYERAFAGGATGPEYERLVSAYLAAYERKKARATLARALKAAPTPRLWSLLGDLDYMEGDYEGAYRAFEQSARLDPAKGRAYLMMAYCAIQMDRDREAVAALEKARRFPAQERVAVRLIRELAHRAAD